VSVLWRLLAGFGVLFHLLAFVLESLLWMRPEVHARFGLDQAGAEATRLIFFNQGFYNLFLALGCATGLVLVSRGSSPERALIGRTLVAFSCLSMAGAGLILAISAPEKLGAACVQGGPPLLALGLAWSTWRTSPSSPAPSQPGSPSPTPEPS
jgi:putative membrane protein